ncbi:hypothetical protein CDG81_09140 [Actinopolyspora erythraea]|uniref:3-hydroxyacyl-CoA dehydrogenase C-terminal domain-containing protein n=1 Tax=Actinopolyspora erythraea TaxID=414996 RepID=A0A099D9U6_9ACTN|nr:3-hydroxyacyl-CoA dehydrogenase family protein [Actinopolyspora erythraea]ASU78419.1 hypothetical protein CDG81_09140 [Actinopolyspora erythraea]KGI82140.1 hypothetical protein IL38_07520 [Actinopolyspora erythraea]
MVDNGEATVEQIDTAVTERPGLRRPLFGPCMNFHLAGGEGGMAHMSDHFGPSLKSPGPDLEAPELTERLRDEMVSGCERSAEERDMSELVDDRDLASVAVLGAVRGIREERS